MTQPASPQVESALIARLLVEPAPLSSLRLTPEDFTMRDLRAAYQAMEQLDREGKPIDVLTIQEVAGEIDLPAPDFVGLQTAPVQDYADRLKDLSLRRRVVEVARDIAKAAKDGTKDQMQANVAAAADLMAGVPGGPDLGLVDLRDFNESPPPPLLGVLSPGGTTILYGEGGDGKGWVAARWASQLPSKVAIIDFEAHPEEWGNRLSKFGLDVGTDVLYFSPSTTFERWANERAARLLRKEEVGFLIVDSAMYASDVEDPYSPAGAMAYKRARAKLDNLPAILLAHTTGSQDKVFGSVFWRNEARVVWRLGKDKQGGRFIQCRKANNYRELENRTYYIEFDQHHGVLNLHEQGKAWSPQAVSA